jgi:hypothetical protein
MDKVISWRQLPLPVGMCFLAFFFLWRGYVVLGTTHDASVSAAATQLEKCETKVSTLTDLMIGNIQFGQQRAQATVDKIEQKSSTAKPDVKLSIKPQPVTNAEKTAALSPIVSTDPKELAKKQDAVHNLVTKTAPTSEAQVIKTKGN